ncbi:hypothetical protein [Paenibacillus rigui]|uniref:Uncharacterized protein n=1 Tax=Paenibacillus rigui TaxID=554312 RepID=A0A229UXB8_9BACL|nr:hypothetical protein [Paenibacillus rigui]OXM88003.1 hypothetical protein CF651_02600 [Paenibacillus rigui]
MWESVLKKEHWEIQVNPDNKSIQIHVDPSETKEERIFLELDQSELFELLHTFLSINRSFNNETMYYDDLETDPV